MWTLIVTEDVLSAIAYVRLYYADLATYIYHYSRSLFHQPSRSALFAPTASSQNVCVYSVEESEKGV
jgi:hypothetical protein